MICGRSYRIYEQRGKDRNQKGHTLPALRGLLISMSGDLSSLAEVGVGDFSSGSSCASSSISVLSVPFESTGDGSIWDG